jgi:hypothetical protein
MESPFFSPPPSKSGTGKNIRRLRQFQCRPNLSAVLSDDAQGMYASNMIYSDTDTKMLESLPATAPHRQVDIAIVNASDQGTCARPSQPPYRAEEKERLRQHIHRPPFYRLRHRLYAIHLSTI